MIPLNMQPVEKSAMNPSGALEIVDIWYTIQGEGPLAGCPAVFVRLAGCNLQCPMCDTNYTLGRSTYTLDEILTRIAGLWEKPEGCRNLLVVITGGEPFRQNLNPLIEALGTAGYQVQIETNGTLPWKRTVSNTLVVCSPKTGKIHDDLKPYITALKYVIRDGFVDPTDGLPSSVLGNGIVPAKPWVGFKGEVYLQPCDDADPVSNAANMKAAVDSCLRYGYKLCLQMHKYAGVA